MMPPDEDVRAPVPAVRAQCSAVGTVRQEWWQGNWGHDMLRAQQLQGTRHQGVGLEALSPFTKVPCSCLFACFNL